MRALRAVLLASVVQAAFVGCGEDLVISNADGGATDAKPDAASVPLDAGVDGAVYTESFEGEDPCAGFKLRSGVSVTRVGPGKDGAFGCQLCPLAPDVEGYIYGSFPARGAGAYALRAYIRSPAGADAAAARWALKFESAAANVESPLESASNSGAVTADYTIATSSLVDRKQVADKIRLTFIVPAKSGGCYLLDDIVVTHEP